MRNTHKLLLRSSALLVGVASASARAQDVDTFSLSGALYDRQGTLQLAWPGVGNPGAFYAGAGLSYASQPLVVVYEDDTIEQVVASQTSLRLAGGYNLGGRARLDVELPLYPSVRLAEITGTGVGEQTITSQFAMGDLQLGATVPVWGDPSDGLGLGLAPYLLLPTGSQAAYVSNGGVSGGLNAAGGGRAGAFGWVTNLGLGLGRTVSLDDTLSLGNNVHGGLGAQYWIDETLVAGGELTALLPFVDGFDPWNKRDAEGHLYLSHLGETGLVATLAGGTGLLGGVGAPRFRVALALAYSAVGLSDRDQDGLSDDVDRCPDDPEDRDSFEDQDGCPDPDNDKDGLPDTADRCPNDPEDKDGFEDRDGCPDPDNDQDGLLDAEDACPLEPGPRATQGCPDQDGDTITDREDACPTEPGPVETQGCPDRDGDRVPDLRDRCPDEPVDRRADPAHSDGCPSKVVLAKEQIVILERVYFDFNKATIKPVSYALLNDVAEVINTNPQLKLIEVGGHTDDVGSDAYNLTLSQARVDAVVAYLVRKGHVDPSRLTAVGYGETRPLEPNTTEDGRATNRRVEFNILKQE